MALGRLPRGGSTGAMRYFLLIVLPYISFNFCKAQTFHAANTLYEQKTDSITIKLLANNVTYPTRTDEQGVSSYEEVNGAIGFVDWKTVIIYKDGREIVLDTYIFDEKNNFKKVSKIIARSVALTAYGPPSNYVEFKKISDKICIYLSAGTQMGPKTEGVFVLNPKNEVISRLIFSDAIKKIKDEQKLFKTLDLDKNKEKTANEIRKVLAENNNIRKNDTFRYLGYIDNETLYWEKYKNRNGILYFFYQLTLQEAKVIRYDCFNNEWLIGDYREEEIQEP